MVCESIEAAVLRVRHVVVAADPGVWRCLSGRFRHMFTLVNTAGIRPPGARGEHALAMRQAIRP